MMVPDPAPEPLPARLQPILYGVPDERRSEGVRLRDDGLAKAEYGGTPSTRAARVDWLNRYAAWLPLWAAQRHATFTSDDIRTALAAYPPPSPALWGVATRAAMRAGVIRRVGYLDSTTPSRHAGVASIYEYGRRR